MGNVGGKLIRENSRFDKLQKSFMKLFVPYEKSKQENSWVGNMVEKDLIMIDNWLLL